ncbi:MAG TPA: M48 family metalloprotease [Vicinamibacterales bacterium]|nr:M48 family metalloprotease [Vicinamibacterales bacterium]
MRRTLCTATLVVAALAACAVNPATGKRQLSLVSNDDEIAMGQEEAQKVAASMPILQQQAVQDMVKRVGMEMAKSSERPELPWSFTVLDDPVVNAFALPGGPIFITRGIITHMNSEAELASVLGHEIGHVTARHSASQMSKQQVASLGLGVASVISPTAAQYAGLAQQGLGILMLKYGRDDETQADGLGYRYMLKASWDPREAVKMFQMLQKTSGTDKEGAPPTWMSTHPDPGDRAQRASARLNELANTNLDSLRRNREQFLRAIDGLSYGENPRDGFFRGSTFYQPDLALQITFPDGWQTANQPQVVAAREPEGKALVQVQAAKGASPTEAARAFFSNQGFSNVKEVQVPTAGGPSASAVFAAQTQQGVVEGETTFLTVKGHMYQVLTAAAQGNLQAVDAIHRKVVASAKETTDPAILNIRAPQVKVVQLPRAMTAEEFYSQFPSVLPLDQVLIINGLERGSQLKQGDLVKQVVAGTTR